MFRQSAPLILCLLMAAFDSSRTHGQAPARKTVLDGVYTGAQASRGEDAYAAAECASCHEGGDADGPDLTSAPFIDQWREDTLDNLYSALKTKMPLDKPGSLSDGAYLDILTYILQVNQYPTGSSELTAEGLRNTLMVAHDGPKPLPTNAIVETVACLGPAPGGSWQVTRAREPIRTGPESQISGEETKLAATAPLGNQTFRLLNLNDVQPTFNPQAETGRRVMVKGVLIRESSGDRINVTAIRSVEAGCP